MKAWVISILCMETAKKELGIRVIALLSARKNSAYIKEYLRNLHHMMRRDLVAQKKASKYNKPEIAEIKIYTAGTEFYYPDLPYVFRAQCAEVISIEERNGIEWVKWKGEPYDKIEQDPKTFKIINRGRGEPVSMEAPKANFFNGLFQF